MEWKHRHPYTSRKDFAKPRSGPVLLLALILYSGRAEAGTDAGAESGPHAACVSAEVVRAKLVSTKLQGVLSFSADDLRLYPQAKLTAELESLQNELLRLLQYENSVVIAGAVQGRFPDPGCFAMVWLRHHGIALRVILADASLELKAMGPLGQPLHGISPMKEDDTTIDSMQAIDLDGDGIDEVIEHYTYDHRGHLERGISIFQTSGRQLSEALKLTKHWDDEGARLSRDEVTRYDAKIGIHPAAGTSKRAIVVDGRIQYGRKGRERGQNPRQILGHAVFRLHLGRFQRTAQ